VVGEQGGELLSVHNLNPAARGVQLGRRWLDGKPGAWQDDGAARVGAQAAAHPGDSRNTTDGHLGTFTSFEWHCHADQKEDGQVV
jgi:hypothetical protein